jgi:hypothetical protein
MYYYSHSVEISRSRSEVRVEWEVEAARNLVHEPRVGDAAKARLVQLAGRRRALQKPQPNQQ